MGDFCKGLLKGYVLGLLIGAVILLFYRWLR